MLCGAVLLAGCAVMGETDCRGADWYQLGYRDALYGLRPQVEIYADQCSRFAVKPPEPQYMAGWQDGYTEWHKRVEGSDCCSPSN
ncbi:MAG TPA: DUF2799 domain-containing protein [Burkholderiales bacterium]|nr:DUF2799 domain-containing protein [Burkholderiales bacterium]